MTNRQILLQQVLKIGLCKFPRFYAVCLRSFISGLRGWCKVSNRSHNIRHPEDKS